MPPALYKHTYSMCGLNTAKRIDIIWRQFLHGIKFPGESTPALGPMSVFLTSFPLYASVSQPLVIVIPIL